MDEFFDWCLIIGLVVMIFISGYKTGRWQEQREWKQRIPDTMDTLCTECERVGEDIQRDRYNLLRGDNNG